MVLCLIFGVTDSVCKLFLRFGRLILLEMLKHDSLVAVRMPCFSETISFLGAVNMKYPLLKNAYCIMVGLTLRPEQLGNDTIQTMFYIGWQHDHFANCIFASAPNGTIVSAAINATGSMHYSQITSWGGIYAKLEEFYNEMGGLCVVDSAFCRHMYLFLINSAQNYLVRVGNAVETATIEQATSLRQSAQWGMSAY